MRNGPWRGGGGRRRVHLLANDDTRANFFQLLLDFVFLTWWNEERDEKEWNERNGGERMEQRKRVISWRLITVSPQ